MKRTSMLLAAAAAAAVMSAATGPGSASAAGTDAWDPRYPCASGGFDLGSLTSHPAGPPEDPAVVAVTLHGSLTCDVPVTGARYALAVYPPGVKFGVVNTTAAVLPYESTKGPHLFRVDGGVTAPQGATICVAADTDLRIACVELSVRMSGAAGSVSAREVAVSDPRVAVPLLISGRDIDPSCGTCWRLKKP